MKMGVCTSMTAFIPRSSWFGFISNEKTDQAKEIAIVKLLNVFVSILGFAATIITIVVGWNDFWDIVFKFFK